VGARQWCKGTANHTSLAKPDCGFYLFEIDELELRIKDYSVSFRDKSKGGESIEATIITEVRNKTSEGSLSTVTLGPDLRERLSRDWEKRSRGAI